MTEHYIPAISTLESMTKALPTMGGGAGAEPARDLFQLHVAPSGVSVKGRYWRDGNFLKATVHVQAAGGAPTTVTAHVDLRPIVQAVKRWQMAQRARGVRVGGWPGSFFKKVSSIAKSKLVSQIGHAVKSVVRSKITGAVISAAAVVFPAVGVPAAAAYATANAALSALDKAEAARKEAQAILASGSPAQKAALAARAPEIRATLAKAAEVKGRLREIASRAGRGDLAARKTARIFGHVMQHRKRVRGHERNLQASIPNAGMLVTDYGNIVSGDWLISASAQTGLPLLHAAARPAMRAQPAPRGKHPTSQLSAHRRRQR